MTDGHFSLCQEVLINAPRELVYDFFTQPELLVRWMGVAAEVDAVPGGAMVINVTGRRVTRGVFTELVPTERLVFTWGFTEPGTTEVTVTLTAVGSQTRLRLEHRGFTDEPNCKAHQEGWQHYLGRLSQAAAGTDPGTDSRLEATDTV